NTPVLPGAILAAISWAIVSLIFRLYVSHIGIYSRIYGTVGTAIILMLWLYLSSLVMLIGEQLNVVLGEAIRADKRNLRFYQRP
ncbi:MAG: YhjD/YihY/BrkB family envelope integrity protein, partial [Cyanobacteria bacterium J06555_3]